ncbi:leucine efflux protein LeuE [Parvibium lacunae]|uniref:Leucine efflux protein LeuE n=1 Tax=Parvibium lacunae TaxID=1888893 RepID=A0A368L6P4_9BURK|nr:leucine efflux protein LeuE [Parvibium lacunae]RCS59296.1 leucine efflux protein LeuE [Parvibium lacunae]
MFGITDLYTYVLGTIVIILLPGPNSMYVLSVAAQRGVKLGFAGACGIFVGDTILMLLTVIGAAGILKTFPALFALVKYAGAGYLAWLGLGMLRRAWRSWSHAPTVALPRMESADMRQPFTRALLISLMNPKAILFFVSFFVQFVDPAYPHPGLTFLALGGIVQLFSAMYLTVVIIAGARLANAFRRRQRLSASLNAGVGCVFLGFGAKLAAATLE